MGSHPRRSARCHLKPWNSSCNPYSLFQNLKLLYCNNGHWKLKEWCKQNYSSWTHNNGIQLVKESVKDMLNNSKLLCMETPADHKKELDIDNMSVDGEFNRQDNSADNEEEGEDEER